MPTPDCNRILAHGSHFPFALINLHVLPKIGWIIGWTDDGSHIAPTFVNMLISENELAKLDRKTAASALSIRSASIAKCKLTNWTTITFFYIFFLSVFHFRSPWWMIWMNSNRHVVFVERWKPIRVGGPCGVEYKVNEQFKCIQMRPLWAVATSLKASSQVVSPLKLIAVLASEKP